MPESMADVFDSAKRSVVMGSIRGKGNKDTELRMIAVFREYRITGWRRAQRVVGKPDFVFRSQRLTVFVDGCFWHRHEGCKYAYTPKSRQEFWLPKFEKNVARDRLVTRSLRQHGWKVIRVWECDLAKQSQWPRLARKIAKALEDARPSARGGSGSK
jgi:DNA mismatch endonuclease, patch repair protein